MLQRDASPNRSAALFVDHDNFLHSFGEANDDIPRGWVPWSLLLRYATAELSMSFAVKKAYGDFFSNTKSVFRERNWKSASIRDLIYRDTRAQQELLREGFELVLSPIVSEAIRTEARTVPTIAPLDGTGQVDGAL